jgi:nucleoside-diphosphate-sugar epimerase
VFVSAEPYSLLDRTVLKGYFYGKQLAEKAMLEHLGDRAVVFRPGMVYGLRKTTYGPTLPLGVIGAPLEVALRPMYHITNKFSWLVPPVSVEDLADAAITAIMEPSVHGIHDYDAIKALAKRVPPEVQWSSERSRLDS